MGAGKTTIGKALSKELDMMFYDLDWYIETRMHRTVAQIFYFFFFIIFWIIF